MRYLALKQAIKEVYIFIFYFASKKLVKGETKQCTEI